MVASTSSAETPVDVARAPDLPRRPRAIPALRAALFDDASLLAYRWIYRPLLALQLALYVRGVVLYLAQPSFAQMGGAADPRLHQNHIGNYSIMRSQPDPALLAVHLGMATFWIAAVLFQKHSVGMMATALAAGPDGKASDPRGYGRVRRVHAVLGTVLCAVAIAGCIAGPLIAWQSHGHPPMRTFLLLLPLFFLPAVTTVWVTGRRRASSIRDHQTWANTAFLAPAVASLWAEALIYFCGRHTPLGPRLGELVGTGCAWGLILALVVIPAWRARAAAARTERA